MAIESILAQTVTDLDLIVIDDGSRDASVQIPREPARLAEIEVAAEVAQRRVAFAHVRTLIGPPVGGGVESFAAKEVILDELQVGVVAEDLVVDEVRGHMG